jgi:hypothetical protein
MSEGRSITVWFKGNSRWKKKKRKGGRRKWRNEKRK